MKSLLPVFGLIILATEPTVTSIMISPDIMFRYRYWSDCRGDADSKKSSTDSVRKHLFCDPPYDPSIQPNAKDHRPTIVKLRVFPQSIDFDDTSLLLTFNTWFSMSWVDPRLTWTKEKFPNVTSVSIPSGDIWTSSLSIFDAGGADDHQTIHPSTECLVTMNGTVTCVAAIEPVTHCAPDYQHWPFDTQNCTIRFGSWIYSSDEAEFQLSADEIEMTDFTENLEWKIVSVNSTKMMHKYKGSLNAKPLVFCSILLARRSANMQATVVVPAIVMIIMSLTVLWLDTMTGERMVMAGLNVICHLLCIMDLNWQIPSNGASVSSILVFYKNSMIIAGVAVFLTTFLRQLKKMSIPAPGWLTSTTSLILSSKAGQFVLLATLDPKASATLETAGEDNIGLVQSNSFYPKENPENLGAWYHLATLLDRLSFAGVLFTYAITLLVLIPRNKTYF